MQIQWFPGHMHKAAKQVRETLSEVDILIEVLDARIPFSSQNPMIAEIIGDKPCIKLLNKSDMADPELTAIWQEYFEKNDNIRTIATNAKGGAQLRQITDLCHRMVPNKGGANHDRMIQAMIIGIPNVGKSTLINGFAGRTVAKTGNEPAVTKQQQRIKLEHGIMLIDTPGMMWPKIDHENSGYRLAATGAIKETATDNTDVAFAVAEYLLEVYPERLVDRYKLDAVPESEIELLESIGRLRGSLRSGGSVLLEKVSNILISELRSGFLGEITMEDPTRVEKEQAEVVIAKAAKLIKDEERKKGYKKKRR
jgi:ribosome biogenesis GTPase A